MPHRDGGGRRPDFDGCGRLMDPVVVVQVSQVWQTDNRGTNGLKRAATDAQGAVLLGVTTMADYLPVPRRRRSPPRSGRIRRLVPSAPRQSAIGIVPTACTARIGASTPPIRACAVSLPETKCLTESLQRETVVCVFLTLLNVSHIVALVHTGRNRRRGGVATPSRFKKRHLG